MKNALLIVAALYLVGCSTMDMGMVTSAGAKLAQAASVSDREIETSVSQYIAALDAQNVILTGNDPYAQRLARITAPINNRDGLNIKVYKKNEVNAFAAADGSIRVYSGLMDIMTDEEILGVIGHEIGHVKLKHTKEAFRSALVTSALRDGVASTGRVASALSGSVLGDLAETLASSQYSQKQEYEADNYGYNFLKEHGINPWAMALSFEKLHQLQASGNNSGAVMQLFSTHPEIQKRTAVMVEKATKDGFARPGTSGAATTTRKNTTSGSASSSSRWTF